MNLPLILALIYAVVAAVNVIGWSIFELSSPRDERDWWLTMQMSLLWPMSWFVLATMFFVSDKEFARRLNRW